MPDLVLVQEFVDVHFQIHWEPQILLFLVLDDLQVQVLGDDGHLLLPDGIGQFRVQVGFVQEPLFSSECLVSQFHLLGVQLEIYISVRF